MLAAGLEFVVVTHGNHVWGDLPWLPVVGVYGHSYMGTYTFLFFSQEMVCFISNGTAANCSCTAQFILTARRPMTASHAGGHSDCFFAEVVQFLSYGTMAVK